VLSAKNTTICRKIILMLLSTKFSNSMIENKKAAENSSRRDIRILDVLQKWLE